jgi:hypothetical protein
VRRIFGPKKEVVGGGKDCIMKSFVSCMFHQVLLG